MRKKHRNRLKQRPNRMPIAAKNQAKRREFKPLMTRTQLAERRAVDYSEYAGKFWVVLQFERHRPLVAERVLIEAGQVVYLPWATCITRHGPQRDRMPDVQSAFGGYLFLLFDEDNPPWQTIQNEAVLHNILIDAGKQRIRFVRLDELRMVRANEVAGEYDRKNNIQLNIGQDVLVTEGSLDGRIVTVEALSETVVDISYQIASGTMLQKINVDLLEVCD